MTTQDKSVPVIATAPKDEPFPALKNLTYSEIVDLVGKFLQKAIPIKGAELTILKGMPNRVSSPKGPLCGFASD